MAWTAPRIWVVAEVATAALLNQHLRDNLLETAPAKAVAAGDLFRASAANAIVRLAIGATDQVLAVVAGLPAWAALTVPVDVQTFTASGTWTKPANTTFARIICIGGGGKGGNDGGPGGNGGVVAEKQVLISALGATETVTIGVGGSGIDPDGTQTSFGAHVIARGGAGSAGAAITGSTAYSARGAVGGAASGGAGSASSSSSIAKGGGGGGGGGGAAGGDGGAGGAAFDIAGGAAQTGTGGAGNPGTNAPTGQAIPGGGGGGGGGCDINVAGGTGGAGGLYGGAGGGGGAGGCSGGAAGGGGSGANGSCVVISV